MTAFLCMFFLFYAWHAIGIAIGYHRLLSHRSFKCPKFVEYFFVAGGYLGFMSSPIWWVASHRAHHRYTDTDLDPHSPRQGFWHSHCGWFFIKKYPPHIDPIRQCPDLITDPVYRFLERGGNIQKAHLTNSAIGFGSRLILLQLFGWEVALASVLAGIVVQQIPLFLNALCHMPFLGYKTYSTTDDSVNFWPMGILAFGEGWHNNHHAFPGSARTGMLLHELDISWLIIKSLKLVGLAENVNEAKPSKQLGNLELQPIPVDANEQGRYSHSLGRRD